MRNLGFIEFCVDEFCCVKYAQCLALGGAVELFLSRLLGRDKKAGTKHPTHFVFDFFSKIENKMGNAQKKFSYCDTFCNSSGLCWCLNKTANAMAIRSE
jgi:hypothetical protein